MIHLSSITNSSFTVISAAPPHITSQFDFPADSVSLSLNGVDPDVASSYFLKHVSLSSVSVIVMILDDDVMGRLLSDLIDLNASLGNLVLFVLNETLFDPVRFFNSKISEFSNIVYFNLNFLSYDVDLTTPDKFLNFSISIAANHSASLLKSLALETKSNFSISNNLNFLKSLGFDIFLPFNNITSSFFQNDYYFKPFGFFFLQKLSSRSFFSISKVFHSPLMFPTSINFNFPSFCFSAILVFFFVSSFIALAHHWYEERKSKEILHRLHQFPQDQLCVVFIRCFHLQTLFTSLSPSVFQVIVDLIHEAVWRVIKIHSGYFVKFLVLKTVIAWSCLIRVLQLSR
ncbi:hypothetical protein GEMRC1_005902 [Eukaryota sp. GEM-RC1]